MLSVSNLSIQFGKRILFDEVNVTFTTGNCYGIIGANGAGKSTFLKVLSGQLDPNAGHVHLEPGKRMSVLEQNHFAYDEHQVLQSVIMGNKPLYEIKKEMDDLYANTDFSDADSERVGELQIKFEELKDFSKEMISVQMSQYGQAELPDEELEKIVARVMSNKDEARRLSEQLMSKKLLEPDCMSKFPSILSVVP